MSKQRGFTLIELLVVISIIALLMAMLMPALAKVKDQAKTVACQANLSSWKVAWSMFLEDNGGHFMDHPTKWIPYMEPYFKDFELLLCATATKSDDEGARWPFAARKYYSMENPDTGELINNGGPVKVSLGFNNWCMKVYYKDGSPVVVGGRQIERLWQTNLVRGGDCVPLLIDCGMYYDVCPLESDTPSEYEDQIFQTGGINEMRRCCINRHSGYVNCLFLDFSMRKVGLKELWQLKWHKYWDELITPTMEDLNREGPWLAKFKDY